MTELRRSGAVQACRLLAVLLVLRLLPMDQAEAKTHDPTTGERMMASAALVLLATVAPSGNLQVISGSLARSDGGITFRKVGMCRYSLSQRETDGSSRSETIDFSALTGTYRTREPMFGTTLVIAGTKADTFCYAAGSRSGCSRDLPISDGEGWMADRALLELRFMAANGCGSTSQ